MNFHDSPAEAEFRQRIRERLAESGDSVKRSHSDDSY